MVAPRSMSAATATTTVIVPTADAIDRLPFFVRSLERTAGGAVELMIVRHYRPDADPRKSAAYDRSIGELVARSAVYYVVPFRGPFHYARMMNHALERLRRPTPYVCFANDDVVFGSAGWLGAMVGLLQARPQAAIAGCRLLYPSPRDAPLEALCERPESHYGTIQHAGVAIAQRKGSLHLDRHAPHDHPPASRDRDVDAVTFALALARRSLFDRIRFDEALGYDYNDIDLCLQARAAGYAVVYCASSVHFHLETLSRRASGEHNDPENKRHFLAKWRHRIARSPLPESLPGS